MKIQDNNKIPRKVYTRELLTKFFKIELSQFFYLIITSKISLPIKSKQRQCNINTISVAENAECFLLFKIIKIILEIN